MPDGAYRTAVHNAMERLYRTRVHGNQWATYPAKRPEMYAHFKPLEQFFNAHYAWVRRQRVPKDTVLADPWLKKLFKSLKIPLATLRELAAHCDEFLVHAVDVEGKQSGIEADLVRALGEWSPIPVTYAGGARSLDDLELVSRIGGGKVDLAIGSALDIFGPPCWVADQDLAEWLPSITQPPLVDLRVRGHPAQSVST